MSQSSKESQKERNRREMPNVAEIIDQMTEFFGPVRVIGAEDFETGRRIGKLNDAPNTNT